MFKKAQRIAVKLKIAITGPSGSGKTYSALALAKGLGGKIALIDTENGSASLYSDKFDFDTIELKAPFSTEKYIDAIKIAEKNQYNVLIIDSMSHGWNAEGSILDQKTIIDSRGGNQFTNWKTLTPKQNSFISAITQSNINVICTLRVKSEYIIQENDKGKKVPIKIGLSPIQKEGIEYEFTTVFDISMNHEASVSKDRTSLFVDHIFKINEEAGKKFITWLHSAVQIEEIEPPKLKPLTSHEVELCIQEMTDSKDIKELSSTWVKWYARINISSDKDYLIERKDVIKERLEKAKNEGNKEFGDAPPH